MLLLGCAWIGAVDARKSADSGGGGDEEADGRGESRREHRARRAPERPREARLERGGDGGRRGGGRLPRVDEDEDVVVVEVQAEVEGAYLIVTIN